MAKKWIGVLMLAAGLVTPLHKEALQRNDYVAMVFFIGIGLLCLLLPSRKKTEEDAIYQATWKISNVALFTSEHAPLLSVGEQLLVCPYTGEKQDQITILTTKETVVGTVPAEYAAHVLHKIESHSPVRLTVKQITMDATGGHYTLEIEMIC